MKQSGLGREGASEGIYEFCETQYIAGKLVGQSTRTQLGYCSSYCHLSDQLAAAPTPFTTSPRGP